MITPGSEQLLASPSPAVKIGPMRRADQNVRETCRYGRHRGRSATRDRRSPCQGLSSVSVSSRRLCRGDRLPLLVRHKVTMLQESQRRILDFGIVHNQRVRRRHDERIVRAGQARSSTLTTRSSSPKNGFDFTPLPKFPATIPNGQDGIANCRSSSAHEPPSCLPLAPNSDRNSRLPCSRSASAEPWLGGGEHHDATDLWSVATTSPLRRIVGQITADDDVAHAVGDEVNLVHSREVAYHAVERRRVRVD